MRPSSQTSNYVIAANDGKVKRVFIGLAGPLGPDLDGLKGLLAGFGTALGFLVPPRSRTRATARARLDHEPEPTRNDHDCGQRPVHLTGGGGLRSRVRAQGARWSG